MSDWDGEVLHEEHKLNTSQVLRLLRMTETIREIPYIASYIHQIKELLADDNRDDALALWSDLSEEEQEALWVAQTYGGVFTTAERKALHHKEVKI